MSETGTVTVTRQTFEKDKRPYWWSIQTEDAYMEGEPFFDTADLAFAGARRYAIAHNIDPAELKYERSEHDRNGEL